VQRDINAGVVRNGWTGVATFGRNGRIFSDHTDLRSTLMAFVGLQDDYVHDGRVLVEKLKKQAAVVAAAR
jgi:hypothetical protein